MKKLGIVSDAHGNPYGLQACIDLLRSRGAEALYFLGDAVGYLPLVEEVMAILEREQVACQLGNHEAMLLGMLPLDPAKDAVYRIGDVARRIAPALRETIAAWPASRDILAGGTRVKMVHGSPRHELTEYVYPDSDLSPFASVAADIVFMGHTHIPFNRRIGAVRLVNVGSCGLPRDGTKEASCALFDVATGEPELLRTRFDIGRLLADAKARGEVAEAVRRRLVEP